MSRVRPPFQLVTRSYCHLCDEMYSALSEFLGDETQITCTDIDGDPGLLARFDELVPVLLTEGGEVLCYYHFELQAVREYLKRFE